jgi:hypothetical protein
VPIYAESSQYQICSWLGNGGLDSSPLLLIVTIILLLNVDKAKVISEIIFITISSLKNLVEKLASQPFSFEFDKIVKHLLLFSL